MSWATLARATLFIALWHGCPGPARAGARAPLRIQLILASCADFDPAEVRRLLRIELDADILLPDAPIPADAPRATVTCGDTEVRLHIEDPLTGKSLERGLALRAAPLPTRSRLLSLALAELFLASWAELTLAKVEAPEPAGAPATPPEQSPSLAPPMGARLAASELVHKHTQVEAARPLRLGLHGAFVSFPAYGATALFGAALRLAGELRHRLQWQVDLQGVYGASESALGPLYAVALSAAAALSYQHTVSAWRLRAGGGGRVGAAWLRGSSADPMRALGLDLWGPFAGPMTRLGLARILPYGLALDLELEGGYAPVAVRGNIDGVRALAIEGPWVGVALGLSRSL